MNTVMVDEEKEILVEDIVTYSNIEITHANDNKMPRSKLMQKVIFWGCFFALCGLLFFM